MDIIQKRNIQVLFAVIIFIFYSCSQIKDDIKKIDLVKAYDNKNIISLSSLVDSIEYIPLQSNKSIVVGKNPRVYADSQYIVIIAYKQQLLFDRKTGSFIREIASFGKHPKGYRTTKFNIAFNEKKGTIYADGWNKNIIEYSVSNELLNSFCHPDNKRLTSFACLNDTTYVAYVLNSTGNEKERLLLFSGQNHNTSSFSNSNYYKDNPVLARRWGSQIGWFYQHNGHLFLKELFVDTVYEVKKDRLLPSYIFYSGKHAPPSYEREYIKSEEYISYFWINNVCESNRFIFFDLIHENSLRCCVFDKKYNTTCISNYNDGSANDKYGLKNDIDNYIQFCPEYVNSGGEIISLVQAYDVKKWQKMNIQKKTKPFPMILNDIDENDNPIVMIGKLKE